MSTKYLKDWNSSVIRQKANFKTDVTRKKAYLFFPKNEHLLPNTHTFFSCKTRFEIQPVALSPTYSNKSLLDMIWIGLFSTLQFLIC